MKTAMKIYKVYILPHEKYCGVTSRDLNKRLREHENNGKNINNAFVIAEFENKQEAFQFETNYQLNEGFKGYTYNHVWRAIQSNKCLKDIPSNILKKRVQCIETGVIYDGVRDCERSFSAPSGNLTRHLQGHDKHKTFHKLTFKYYE